MPNRRLLVLCLALLLCACLAACGGGSWFSDLFGAAPAVHGGKGGTPAPTAGPAALAHLFHQLTWLFIGLGVAGFVASFWVPLISTRQALGSILVGVGIAVVGSLIVALYWPIVACMALGGFVAAWPYIHAAYVWAKARITGEPVALTTGLASLKSLIGPRIPNVLAAPGSVPIGTGPAVV